ncbi:MAG: hypothetical protein QXM93_01105 [Candidatus Methanomethyliaceae archaeon]
MGRTVPSYRQAMESEIASWEPFRRALRGKEVEAFDRMMEACRAYASAGSASTRPFISESMFMCILLKQELELMEMREVLDDIKRQLNIKR